MNKILSLMAVPSLMFINACSTPLPPAEQAKALNATEDRVFDVAHLPVTPAAPAIKFKQPVHAKLEPTDPVVSIDPKTGTKSFFKVYKFTPQTLEEVIELRSVPYKPLGFGQIGILSPIAYFYDEHHHLLKAEQVFQGYDRTFADGQFMRVAWRVQGLVPYQTFYMAVAAHSELSGKETKALTNYGAASAGVIFDQSVQFSSVGKFTVLRTDTLTK